MDRLARIMEYFWLALGVLSALWMVWQVSMVGWDAGKVYTWFPLICFAMFFYRRFTRRKMAEWAERKSKKSHP